MDLGAAGSSSDAQIFKHSDLRHKIKDSTISFPESESLVDDGPEGNYFILGDDAFPIKLWLMKPYSRRGMYYSCLTTGSRGEEGWWINFNEQNRYSITKTKNETITISVEYI